MVGEAGDLDGPPDLAAPGAPPAPHEPIHPSHPALRARRPSGAPAGRARSPATATGAASASPAIAGAYTPALFVTITPRSASPGDAKLSIPAPVEWIQCRPGIRSASSRNESGPSYGP